MRRAIVQSPGHRLHPDRRGERRRGAGRSWPRAGVTSVDELRRCPPAASSRSRRPSPPSCSSTWGRWCSTRWSTATFVPATPSVAIAAGAASERRPPDRLHRRRDAAVPRSACRRAGRGGPGGVGAVLPHVPDGPRPGRRPVAPAGLQSYVTAMPAARPATKGSDHWAAIQTDGIMRQPVLRVADSRPTRRRRSSTSSTGRPAGPTATSAPSTPSSCRSSSTRSTSTAGTPSSASTREDGTLGRAMRSAWAAFAATGDPSGGDLGTGRVTSRRRARRWCSTRAAASSTTRWPRNGRGGPACGPRRPRAPAECVPQ